MVKKGDIFTKDVTLKSASDKIYYKVRTSGELCFAKRLKLLI